MENFHYNLKTLGFSLILVPIPATVGYFAIKDWHKDFSSLGSFGDFVAGTTVPVLTFISFLALVLTLRLQSEQLKVQSEQLKVQNEELRNSVGEMKATREEFELQNKTMSIQRFENTFFQMVNLHNDIVNNISYESVRAQKKGRDSFEQFYIDFKRSYEFKSKDINDFTLHGKDQISRIREIYIDFFNNNESQLGHYFRNLYRIVKFIDESPSLNIQEKKTYIGILRAQLSSNELALLLYNSLHILNNKFLLLMYKYDLLDGINEKILCVPSHYDIYKNEAELYK